MSETAIACLITAPEEISPLLETIWEIKQYEQQGSQLIELSEIGLEDFTEASTAMQKQSQSIQRTLENLKKAKAIAAPMTILGF